MKRLAVSAGLVIATVLAPSGVRAEPIPIEEELVFAQTLFGALDWALAVDILRETEGFVDVGADLAYTGTFSILLDPAADPLGTFEGLLAGLYLGDFWETSFAGSLRSVVLDKVIEVDSVERRNGRVIGTDRGTITEKPNNKADVDIRVTKFSSVRILRGELTKTKAGGKLVVEGILDQEGKRKPVRFELDQATKEFTYADSIVKGGGRFSELTPDPDSRNFELNYDVKVVPEPGVTALVASGLFMHYLRRRKSLTGRSRN